MAAPDAAPSWSEAATLAHAHHEAVDVGDVAAAALAHEHVVQERQHSTTSRAIPISSQGHTPAATTSRPARSASKRRVSVTHASVRAMNADARSQRARDLFGDNGTQYLGVHVSDVQPGGGEHPRTTPKPLTPTYMLLVWCNDNRTMRQGTPTTYPSQQVCQSLTALGVCVCVLLTWFRHCRFGRAPHSETC